MVYCHGGPGSPCELSLFGACDFASTSPVYAPDRFALFAGFDASTAFDQLAKNCTTRFPEAQFHLIGFSLGGYVALELAHRLEGRVSRIDLIAPAAPLEGGMFLEKMAGKALFALARDRPDWLLTVLRLQAILARGAIRLLYRMLFATATGDDRVLVSDPQFRTGMAAILRSCFGHPPSGFARELKSYVRPWAHILPEIVPPVRLWHGTEDNWAPYSMSEYLLTSLPHARLETIVGGSHYSTLKTALARMD